MEDSCVYPDDFQLLGQKQHQNKAVVKSNEPANVKDCYDPFIPIEQMASYTALQKIIPNHEVGKHEVVHSTNRTIRTQSTTLVGAILNLVFASITFCIFLYKVIRTENEPELWADIYDNQNAKLVMMGFIFVLTAIIVTNPICLNAFGYNATDFIQGIHGTFSLLVTLIIIFLIGYSQNRRIYWTKVISEGWRIGPNWYLCVSLILMLISTIVQLGQSCCTCQCKCHAA